MPSAPAVHTKPNHCIEQAAAGVTPIQTAFPFCRTCPIAQSSVEASVYLVLIWALLLLLAGPTADDMMLGWEACRTARAAGL